MKFLVCGYGSIAKRHIQNIRAIQSDARITVLRHAPGEETIQGVDRVVYSLADALRDNPRAALITNPASMHICTALALAEQGVHLFIEKPLSDRWDCVTELFDLCTKRKLVLLVGYQYRFYEPLIAVKQAIDEGLIGRILSIRAEVGQYLPDWRPGVDYRIGVSARSELGGGAIFELSHELDYVRWFGGDVKAVNALYNHISELDTNVEDLAEIILQFNSGAIGSIHLDFLQHQPYRMLKIIGQNGMLAWNGMDHLVHHFSNDANRWECLYCGTRDELKLAYIRELQYFIDCIHEDRMIDSAEALETLRLIMRVKA
jgi:predicted dehydrogenase